MKKWVYGLVGIALGLTGCKDNLSIDCEVSKIGSYDRGIRNILKLNEGDSCNIFKDEKGRPYWILIRNEKELKSIRYLDSDGDGKYDQKTTIIIPNKLEILGVVPDPNYTPNKDSYFPEKKLEDKKDDKIWASLF